MKVVEVAAFAVVGLEARTAFALESSPAGLIPAQWDRVMKEGLLETITNRLDSDIIALYTDYESDEYGVYTFVLGAKVSSADNVPEGMVVRSVPASRYAVFTSPRGPVTRIVYEAWKRIWSEPRTDEYARSYRVDFEVYSVAASDPADSQIEIFVGVK